MGGRPFTLIAAIIFGIMALAHAYRLATGCEVTVGGTELPMWVSLPALLVTGLLATMLFREARR